MDNQKVLGANYKWNYTQNLKLIENKIKKIENEIAELTIKVNIINNTLNDINTSILDINNSLTLINTDLSEIKQKILVIENSISVIENKISVIENSISVIENSISVIENKISVIENKISVIENKLTFLENIQKITTGEIDLTLDNTIVIDMPFGLISENLTILSVMVYNVEKLTIEPLTNYSNCKFKISASNKLTFISTVTGASIGGMSEVIFTVSKY